MKKENKYNPGIYSEKNDNSPVQKEITIFTGPTENDRPLTRIIKTIAALIITGAVITLFFVSLFGLILLILVIAAISSLYLKFRKKEVEKTADNSQNIKDADFENIIDTDPVDKDN